MLQVKERIEDIIANGDQPSEGAVEDDDDADFGTNETSALLQMFYSVVVIDVVVVQKRQQKMMQTGWRIKTRLLYIVLVICRIG